MTAQDRWRRRRGALSGGSWCKRFNIAASTPRLPRAAERLQQGALAVFPTETFYGLGTRADDAEAVAHL